MRILRRQPRRTSEEEHRLADVLDAQQHHQEARQAKAKAAVRRAAVAEEIQVELDRLQPQAFLQRLLLEDLIAVLALRAGGDLQPVGDQVEGAGQRRVFGLAHVVERPHAEPASRSGRRNRGRTCSLTYWPRMRSPAGSISPFFSGGRV